MITRRHLLKAGLATPFLFGGYALAEPQRLVVTHYHVTPRQWPADLKLKIAVIADIHAINPWMTPDHVDGIVRATNMQRPDIVLLAGDYEASMPRFKIGSWVSMDDCGRALSRLQAPLGAYAVLGNHDVATNGGENVRRGFTSHGIPVLENAARRIVKDGKPFWLLGLGDQYGDGGRWNSHLGYDDLPGTLARIGDDAPAILLAHEPDIFVDVPDRVALTVSGHTHGGQVLIPGYGPLVVPSRFGSRFRYGHIVENDRHLVVSGGLGTSGIPIRFGVPPEIVLITLGASSPPLA
ncbi:phosphohydrolase [Labrys miyagiensis]